MMTEFPPLAEMALFLDFDGTLAPLQDDAEAVALPDGLEAVLLRLRGRLGLGPVLISGRDLDDLSRRTPQALMRIGNHGLRQAKPGEAPAPLTRTLPAGLTQPLQAVLDRHPGVFAESKGPVTAVHFRAAPDAEAALRAGLSALPLAPHGYHLEAGKMIFELKPDGASKGAALSTIMADHAELIPVMIGDDTTDEAAMAAAQDLGGIGVKVGKGATCATIRLDGPDSVAELLQGWAA